MGKYRIDHNFQMIGAFWQYGVPDEIFTGTLTSRKGRVEVLTAPSYTSSLGEDSLVEAFREINGNRDRKRIPAVCGFTTDNDCTLLDSSILGGGGTTSFPRGQKIGAKRYVATQTVMGLHLESADAESIDSSAFYFTKVHQFLPKPWIGQMSQEGTSYSIPTEGQEVF